MSTEPKMGDRVSESWQSRLGDPPGARADLLLSQTYPAIPESVAAVRASVADATHTHAPPATIAGVKLAVSEAATNVVVHAYADASEPGLIHVEAVLAGGELRVSVTDSGPGLRPRDDAPGLGLGLAIIGELADKVELLQGGNGGLHVLMRFAVAPSTTDS